MSSLKAIESYFEVRANRAGFVKWARAEFIQQYPRLINKPKIIREAPTVCYYFVEYAVQAMKLNIARVNIINDDDSVYIVVFLRSRTNHHRHRFAGEHAFFIQRNKVLHTCYTKHGIRLETKPRTLVQHLNKCALDKIARQFKMYKFSIQDPKDGSWHINQPAAKLADFFTKDDVEIFRIS